MREHSLDIKYLKGEFYENDIRSIRGEQLPHANIWTFGAPCQDFSIAGKRQGLNGDRSSLVREIFRLLEERKEEDKPEWLIYENVKGMLSSNRGLDFLSILAEMDRLGYDCQWQVVNSRWWVPQNRERVYTVGHFRRYGRKQIFPIAGASGENHLKLLIAGKQGRRVYSNDGIACTLAGEAGGHGAKTGLYAFGIDKSCNHPRRLEISNCLSAREDRGVSNKKAEGTAVAIPMGQPYRYGYVTCAVWSEKYNCYLAIRKLTPRECFRLQGWTDEYFDKAKEFNSDAQLYKQAGNGVTVSVIKEIGKKL